MATFPVIADPSQVLLIDTSKWQDDPSTPKNVDYALMKSRGCYGVIMKVGQGLFQDRDWRVNFINSTEANLPKGGYWYYDNLTDPKRQATIFVNSIDFSNLELGLWLDLEDKRSGQYQGWKNWYNFLEKVKELRPGVKIGIYTGYYYWTERTVMSQIPPSSLNYFKQYPLWIASYNVKPRIPDPWKSEYVIWQFTDLLDGKFYGTESIELDGNYFNGTTEEYQTFFGLGDTPLPPPIGEAMTEYTMTPIWNGTRIRKDHNTYAAVLSSQNIGDSIRGNLVWVASATGNEVEEGDKWLFVTHVNGVELLRKGWMAYIHKGMAYCKDFKETGAVPPPPVDPTPVHLKHTIEVYSDGSLKIDGQPY